ncbi:MAG: hypothetical protein Q8P26_04405 [Candidatus Levybacteria bacterium]|nr:hypothetical protein [Candidatus Levybacteria bacterium]
MKISNFKFLISNLRQGSGGFTLVEILVSVVVLVAVGAIVGGMVASSLRGTNKTTNIENIRQNGNYALNQIAKNIEYSQIFNGVSDDGENYVTSCPFSVDPTPVPVTTSYSFIKVTPLNSDPITYSCTSSVPFTIMANGVSLIDTESLSLTDCSLACIQTRVTDMPIIKIGFRLGAKNANGLLESSTPSILFQTSVIIRNYKK